jgi:magnesium-transporting ATPase (P-type)
MNIKAILFFSIIFFILFYLYFSYNSLNFFPFESSIKFIVLIIGIIGIMFPNIINMVKTGEDNNSIKKYIINKYKNK